MSEVKTLRFGFAGINTDEFAILSEEFDPSKEAGLNSQMSFHFDASEKVFSAQVKYFIMQQQTTIAVIAVSCHFSILAEDWGVIYSKESLQLKMPKLLALHFANLTVSTARGVWHTKTEKTSLRGLIIPPLNTTDFIKNDLVLTNPQTAPTT